MFQKDMRISLLLDYYGALLGEQRRSIMELYYNEDLSLSEISEHMGITRQAVRDSIKKGEQELSRMEEALHLADRLPAVEEKCCSLADRLLDVLPSLKNEESKTAIRALADEIRSIPKG